MCVASSRALATHKTEGSSRTAIGTESLCIASATLATVATRAFKFARKGFNRISLVCFARKARDASHANQGETIRLYPYVQSNKG